VGIIFFTLTVSSVLTLALDLGISSTVVREVSARFAKDPEYIHDLMRTGSLLYWGAWAVLALLLWLAAPWLVHRWIRLETLEAPTAVAAVRIFGAGALLILPRSIYVGLLRGLQRMDFTNAIDAAASAVQQGGVLAILVFWPQARLEAIAWWLSAAVAGGLLAYVVAVLRFLPARALVPGLVVDVLSRNYRFASRLVWITVLSLVMTHLDRIVVSRLLPVGVFGSYAFGHSVVAKAAFLGIAIGTAAYPLLSSLSSAGAREEMGAQYRKLQDLTCFGTVPLFAAVPFAVVPVFGHVFEPEVGRALLLPLTWVTVGSYLNGMLNIPYFFSLAVDRADIAARLQAYALLICVPICLVAVSQFGLAGAGFSWMCYQLFAFFYAVPRLCRECLEIEPAQWYRHAGRVLALAGGTYGLVWLALAAAGLSASTLGLAVGYGVATAVYAVVAYFLLGVELRGSLHHFFGAAGRRLSGQAVVR
jgi:O-antigen/teichoic acid export membrane protein